MHRGAFSSDHLRKRSLQVLIPSPISIKLRRNQLIINMGSTLCGCTKKNKAVDTQVFAAFVL